jgi:hypothetical protein
VFVVPEFGEADPSVRLPLSGQLTARTGTTKAGSMASIEIATPNAIARPSRSRSRLPKAESGFSSIVAGT